MPQFQMHSSGKRTRRKGGWFRESARHAKAARGIKSNKNQGRGNWVKGKKTYNTQYYSYKPIIQPKFYEKPEHRHISISRINDNEFVIFIATEGKAIQKITKTKAEALRFAKNYMKKQSD